jgi:hypothetical protein
MEEAHCNLMKIKKPNKLLLVTMIFSNYNPHPVFDGSPRW